MQINSKNVLLKYASVMAKTNLSPKLKEFPLCFCLILNWDEFSVHSNLVEWNKTVPVNPKKTFF
jgi:hypothetical protein